MAREVARAATEFNSRAVLTGDAVFFCRHGMTFNGSLAASLTRWFLTLLFVQVSPVFGQNPSVEPLNPSLHIKRPLSPRGDRPDGMESPLRSKNQTLTFEETEFSVNK